MFAVAESNITFPSFSLDDVRLLLLQQDILEDLARKPICGFAANRNCPEHSRGEVSAVLNEKRP